MHASNHDVERATRTWRKRSIAILCGCDPDLPINLWDEFILQVILTFNLLCCLNLSPNLSAYAQIRGQYNFYRTPITPSSTKIMVHEKLTTWETWKLHTSEAWYLGPAIPIYHYYRVWVWEARYECMSNTLACIPTNVVMPIPGSNDRAIAVTVDIVTTLNHPVPATALTPIHDNNREALHQLATIFANHTAANRSSSYHRHQDYPRRVGWERCYQ